ncbi:Type I restriction enzyme R protein N terminus (HSDR_N), partial [Ruminococcus sp. YRD2003]|uniref:type I restriction endonuclease n=1 Tax=Ruminococcus sp. YRD2003 TaxID=1452313 RepID=UPI0008B455BA
MSVDETNEKRFESDIEADMLAGGYTRNNDTYDAENALYLDTLIRFVKGTQPKSWQRFELQSGTPEKFAKAFQSAVDMDGLLAVLRNGFKHRGIPFRVCYFKPESGLNQTATDNYNANEITVNRQWYYSADNKNSVDMVIAVNGIPVFAFELK